MHPRAVSPDLHGWTVISLRPAAQQAAALAAIEARGARAIALPGLELHAMPDARGDLLHAIKARYVIFTSPAAVQFAGHVMAGEQDGGDPPSFPLALHAIAVGSGTARALAAIGIAAQSPPADAMRSEGVLDLPALQAGEGTTIGVVTAPGGRDLIVPTLRARGFDVRVAQVYRRERPSWSDAETDAVARSHAPRAVLVTSGEALAHVLEGAPAATRAALLDAVAVASSERLARQAREAGFATTLAAASPRVESLLDALAAHAKAGAIR